MLFHSETFLFLFLPSVLLAYYALARSTSLRLWLLLFGSLVFYGYWEIRLVPLLVGSILFNWVLAFAYLRALRAGRAAWLRRWLVPAVVGLNLVVLGVFKYADFFSGTMADLFGWQHDGWGIMLPLGISFFTFKQIAYLVDLQRGRAPQYPLRDYALHVTFFPQLIAGPIVRHSEVIHQYALSPLRPGVAERLGRGGALFLVGLAKKLFLADPLASIADPLFASVADGRLLGFTEGWGAVLAFGLQIYFDFSAYSDMALGLGLAFGFTLPANFDMPYRATSVRDFWHRWHMTLSRFLRDYLYIPLGGSRHGSWREATAVMVTMLLGGLWHGAAWTFVAWGGLHGAALVINHAWRRSGRVMPLLLGWALTMWFVAVAWAMFRATSFDSALAVWTAMAGLNGFEPLVGSVRKETLLAIAAALAVIGPSSQRFALELLRPWRVTAVGFGLAFAYMALRVGGAGEANEFIYFQF